MLSTETAPLPGAEVLTALRVKARQARRTALISLTTSIATLPTAQLLAERAPTRETTQPLAILALTLFLLALPAMAITQVLWCRRARRVRARERELFAASTPPRPLPRLALASTWALTLLLGLTIPRLFKEAALYDTADVLVSAGETLTLTGYATGLFFALWWIRDALRKRSPGDPWDPGEQRARRPASTLLWIIAATATTALLAARAHLWEPPTPLLYVLLSGALLSLAVRGLVTDE
ncbi:hypothetical protein [Nonomuraea sp. NPDC046570]|uniref:hypothetical protein n=1 Tax=Nonomuraea sp. NPDC046570 TaxID=3155255 RepID=UPI003405DEE6